MWNKERLPGGRIASPSLHPNVLTNVFGVELKVGQPTEKVPDLHRRVVSAMYKLALAVQRLRTVKRQSPVGAF